MKKFLYFIIGISALYLILCLFGPSTIKVERSIDIKTSSVEDLQHKLADFKFFHDKWSPWTRKDPNMKKTYAGVCCEPGSDYSWESENDSVGKGNITFNKFSSDSILFTFIFDEMEGSKMYYITKTNNETMHVIWGMQFNFGFFERAPMLFMNMDKMIGPDYEKGLANLKNVIESMPTETANTYEVKELNWDAKTFYGVKDKLSFEKIAAFFGTSYEKIGEALGKANVQAIGMPKAIYFTFDEKTMITDVAAVMEVANGTKLDDVEKFETPASKVLLIEHFGNPDNSINAHYAMDAYMKEKGLTQLFMLEESVVDNTSEKDTSKWQINILYLVK